MRFALAVLLVLVSFLTAACGPTAKRVTVPDVKNLDIYTAFAHLRRAGLRVTVTKPFLLSAGPDLPWVVTERPRAGSTAARGSVVSLRLGAGKGPPLAPNRAGVRVPRLTGLLLSRAVLRLEARKLPSWAVTNPIVVREATARDLFDAYRVYSQHPAAGETSTRLEVVTLRVRPLKSLIR
jgi:beta-lactam-binding protein with PASTA domain